MVGKKKLDKDFGSFGIVGFTFATKVNDFIKHLENGKIKGTYCSRCSKYFFPPRADCHLCLSSNLKWFNIGDKGILVSYSELKFAPKGFEQDLPYSIALLDLKEYKIFGRIDNSVDLKTIYLGMEMEIVTKKLRDERIGYVFREI